jgi:hypothetical protein
VWCWTWNNVVAEADELLSFYESRFFVLFYGIFKEVFSNLGLTRQAFKSVVSELQLNV